MTVKKPNQLLGILRTENKTEHLYATSSCHHVHLYFNHEYHASSDPLILETSILKLEKGNEGMELLKKRLISRLGIFNLEKAELEG